MAVSLKQLVTEEVHVHSKHLYVQCPQNVNIGIDKMHIALIIVK